MNLNQLIGTAKLFLKANSPVIASVAAGVGTVATAYFTAKATFRASDIIRDNEAKMYPPRSKRTSMATSQACLEALHSARNQWSLDPSLHWCRKPIRCQEDACRYVSTRSHSTVIRYISRQGG
jgi:hypothetical protein